MFWNKFNEFKIEFWMKYRGPLLELIWPRFISIQDRIRPPVISRANEWLWTINVAVFIAQNLASNWTLIDQKFGGVKNNLWKKNDTGNYSE